MRVVVLWRLINNQNDRCGIRTHAGHLPYRLEPYAFTIQPTCRSSYEKEYNKSESCKNITATIAQLGERQSEDMNSPDSNPGGGTYFIESCRFM